ncbi:hypothetical protein JTE90_007917 [Oedothorax gibbosus]|uniref:Uncharacterized protein n=1 Tax=Oedothorax gibbosus TaxID=931172 RepID=A0AAV6VHN2_9ARAC|nr:hypothetical protein JTE90_007917 [Oedothorax gibbosus]
MSGVKHSCVALLLLIVAVAVMWRTTEGRYLPTRADNTRYEQIKGLITALLDEADRQNRKERNMEMIFVLITSTTSLKE